MSYVKHLYLNLVVIDVSLTSVPKDLQRRTVCGLVASLLPRKNGALDHGCRWQRDCTACN